MNIFAGIGMVFTGFLGCGVLYFLLSSIIRHFAGTNDLERELSCLRNQLDEHEKESR